MAQWTIYGSNNQAKAVVKELELHDEWMAECFLTVSVKNATPIAFAVGDYIDYRGERYTIQYDPNVLKKAESGSYGEGFNYDNIKFVGLQDEVVRCDFNDIVLNDNNVHYTALPTFPFYCETVDDLLDRIQANLEDLYPGQWIVIGLNTVRNTQRGTAVNRAAAFTAAYKQYIDPTGAEKTDPYGKTSVAETVDNITCWDALKKVHDDFELNFIVRGRVIIVGTAGVFTANTFRYGKGNGLYEIERIGESDQRIVTRLRAYGSEENLPSHYYSDINKRVYATVTTIKNKFGTTGADFLLDLDFSPRYFTYLSESYPGTPEAPNYIIEMTANNVTVRGYVTNDSSTNKCYIYCESVASDDDRDEPDASKMAAFVQALAVNNRLDFVDYVNKDAFGDGHYDYATSALPDNMSVSRLMLPGFPNQSLAAWVNAHKNDEDKEWLAQAVADGFTFSTDAQRPYIDSPNKDKYGIRPASIYFDGSDETDDIHPTIEGMKYNNVAIDEVYEADQISDNGVYPAGTEVPNFKITLPNLGFDLKKVYQDGASIDMKNGMCGARSFKMAATPTHNSSTGRWTCEVNRVHDDSLDLWFPYNDFQIASGDKYVLVGIEMPDEYIAAAAVKLLQASIDALRKNHEPRYTYQPRIDEIWMQRQHDTAMSSQGIISLHDTLKAGDIFGFADDEILGQGVTMNIIIDILTIKENGNNGIPTYDVTLRNDKQVGTIQKVTNKIESIISGSIPVNSAQTVSLINRYGDERYISKLNDDIAKGLIGFVRGLWVKMKGVFGIDQDGNARVNALNAESDAHLNGQTFADDIQSSNYTGEGVADTGFRLMREDAAGSSKLVVDNLYVRKKATFEELEVRKETAIAGNQIYSGAANVILRTDYYGVDDPTNHDFTSQVKLLGYSTTVVPWLLRKVPFLLNGQFFGRLRKTRVVLEDADIPKIRLVRCYFLAKDDEKETFNLWKIQQFDANNNPIDGTGNDFARCQSFNLSSSKRKTYIRSMETKAGNVYWWRKLCGLSERPVTLDDNRQYHFIDVRFDYNEEERYRQQEQQCPWCDVASGDIPAAGDQVVQFGNDMNPDRMNLIAVEVNSSADAPAHKWYKGIYTFDLNKCWWGGNPRKDMISAASGVEFYGPEFKIVTEYGIAKVPKDRAEVEWTNITPQRDDYGTHENVRKCYNYDAITHNGSRWLCLMQDGAHWVRPQVWDDDSYALFDEDGNYKHNGDFISSTEYSQLSTSRKAQCGRVADYTTKEPSTDDEVWKKIVAKGDNSVRIDLDNENDTMLYSSSKGLVSGNVVSTGTLWDGITDVTGLATWSIVATNCTATISDNTVTVTAMSEANGSVLVKALYNGINYEKALTLKRIIDGDKYELIVTPNSIPYNSTADNPAATTLAIQIWKTACDGTRALSAPPTGFNLYANGNALTASETGVYSYTTDNSAIDSVAIKIATSASATDSLDSETIPVVKAENGASITKSSETYRYATNNTGVRPAADSQDWQTTKPTLNKGYWLYTETTITWSDNSTTILYTDERNPNDGIAGQNIIVDGSTVMKYYVGDSNTTHPADDSSDWKDLSQVTQTQGKWLWSQATTYYRKADSSAGSHDAGTSYNYNVSYIAVDGGAGRGITSVTEYYKANNSTTAPAVDDSAWDTDPNLSHRPATEKWDANHIYLWNYEKVTYSSGTTVERTTPQIVAIWTQDGKGIDSIVNYYKVTDTNETPSKPSTHGTGGWDDDPIAPNDGQYLWNYEVITFTDNTTYESDVQLIGHTGADAIELGENYINNSLSPFIIEPTGERQEVISGKTYDISHQPTVGLNVVSRVRITLSGCSVQENAHIDIYTRDGLQIMYLNVGTENVNQVYEVKDRIRIWTLHTKTNGDIFVRLVNFNAGGTVTLERFKLEVGEKSTAWSLSEHDKIGATGASGKDGWMISADPANVIITQGLGNNASQFTSQAVTFSAKKGSVDATIASVLINHATDANTGWTHFIGSVSGTTITVTQPDTYTEGQVTKYYTEGYFVAKVGVTDPDTNSTVYFYVKVPCYANLLGSWEETVVADVKHEVATSKFYFEDENGNVVAHETIGDYIKSSTENISKLTKKVDDGKNLLKGVLTGEDWRSESGDTFPVHQIVPVLVDSDGFLVSTVTNAHVSSPLITLNKGVDYVFSFDGESAGSVSVFIFDPSHYQDEPIELTTSTGTRKEATFKIDGTGTISVYINTHIGKLRHPQLEEGTVATEFSAGDTEMTSSIKQTADEIEALVNDTGVDITNKNINLYADKVKFYKNKASATAGDAAKIWIDGGDGSLHAVDGNFEGTVRAKNLFHNVLIHGNEYVYYCQDDNVSPRDGHTYPYVKGRYYLSSELDSYWGTTNLQICTYDADIIVVSHGSYDTNGVSIDLPLATDFDGKIVEIVDTRYTQSSASPVGGLTAYQCDGASKMRNEFGATPAQYVKLNSNNSHDGGNYRLLSYDGYWVRLSTIGNV